MNGVLLIRKEKGFTSFDVVAVVRRTLLAKKVGHTGTLDPNATGVLPVLLGTATKAQDVIPCHDKRYLADFRLGVATDTLDIWGVVTEEKPTAVTKDEIENVLPKFCGAIRQIPPMYSAVSVDGKRLYQYAREGRQVERRPRTVTVYALELIAFDEQTQTGRLAVFCSKGTYIRTLIDDIARALGTVGVMTALDRTEACGFCEQDAVTLDELKSLAESGTLPTAACYRDIESLFFTYPALVVSDKQAHRFINGNPLDVSRTALRGDAPEHAIYRLKDGEGRFLSLGVVENNEIKMYKHF